MQKIILLFLLGDSFLTFGNTLGAPDEHLRVGQIIARHNFPSEAHTIKTLDGYFLTIYRIPFNPGGPLENRQPVLLQHGLLCSAAAFTINGNMSLAFLLSRAGYDVWLGNFRGNRYSNFHLNYTTQDKKFWDYSFDELSRFDVSAMIDYIEHVTKQTGNILYIGHSMGTTSFFALVADQPKYNEKVKAMFALAPVAYMTTLQTPLRYLAPLSSIIVNTLTFLNIYAMGTETIQDIMINLASISDYAVYLVIKMLFFLTGFTHEQYDNSLFKTFLHHVPSSSSMKTVQHYTQLMASKEFRKFDYGKKKNFEKYKESVPPSYNLTNIKLPVNLYYSASDWLAGKKDSELLAAKLPNKFVCEMKFQNFDHIGFMWSNKAPQVLYIPLINNMQRYSKTPVSGKNASLC